MIAMFGDSKELLHSVNTTQHRHRGENYLTTLLNAHYSTEFDFFMYIYIYIHLTFLQHASFVLHR